MKIEISKSELQSKLKTAGTLIQSKSVDSLSEFLFRVDDGKLSVTGGCDNGSIRVDLKCELSEANNGYSFTISPDVLTKAISKLPEQPISIKIKSRENGSSEAKFLYCGGQFALPIGDASDYNEIKMIDPENVIDIPSTVLSECLKRSYPLSIEDELRPAISGVFINRKDNHMSFVVSQMHRIGVISKRLDGGDISLNMPRIVAKCISDTLSTTNEDIKIQVAKNSARIASGDTCITFRLIEGNYPNYRSVIPQNTPIEIMLDRVDFTEAIGRVSLFSGNQIAKLHIKDGELSISAEDIDFSRNSTELITLQKSSINEFEIGINLTRTLEVLSVIPTSSVSMQFIDASKVFVIRAIDDSLEYDRIYAQTPCMLT